MQLNVVVISHQVCILIHFTMFKPAKVELVLISQLLIKPFKKQLAFIALRFFTSIEEPCYELLIFEGQISG